MDGKSTTPFDYNNNTAQREASDSDSQSQLTDDDFSNISMVGKKMKNSFG